MRAEAAYLPTLETIWAEAERIRAAWSERVRRHRQIDAPRSPRPATARLLLPREQLEALLAPGPLTPDP